MDNYNSDIVLAVVQYLNIVDSGRLALSGKRYYYLVHQYRQLRGPELVTTASWKDGTHLPASDVARGGILRMQQAPNLALAFQTPRSALSDHLANTLPKDTVILGVIADDIQVNHPEGEVEHKSRAALMSASFPGAVITPFSIDFGPKAEDEIESLRARLLERNESCCWKAIIVYMCGRGNFMSEKFVTRMQRTLPDVAIVGGICSQGYVSKPKYTKEELSRMTVRLLKKLIQRQGLNPGQFIEKSEIVDHILNSTIGQHSLEYVENSVFGVILGGNAPVRSMVSRGVKSIIQGVPSMSSPLVVKDVFLARPGDDCYLFDGEDLKPIHMIRQIYNKETGKTSPATEYMTKSVRADFIGLKRQNHDGFELNVMSQYCQSLQAYLIMTDGSPDQLKSLQDAELDFFVLDGKACLEHMDHTVSKLKEQTRGEEILGAVMFSCSGRGPMKEGMLQEEMADATRFAKFFPDVPCLGFYAGGEIGPMALAGNENVFQTGRATVQGFTAVFALFIVPILENHDYHHLDDCRENVTSFVQSRLSNTAHLII
mmetsp:Transcript_1022/g.1281  ORF Transcript_1022/g.1281 Transcript_1022/m.1281 type:complete len:543 (+) Transcript_1022:123-1751(+)